MTITATDPNERIEAAAAIPNQPDVAGQGLTRVGRACGIRQGCGIDRRNRSGHDRGDVVSRRRFGRDVVKVAAHAADNRELRVNLPLVLGEDPDVAQAGVRHPHGMGDDRSAELYRGREYFRRRAARPRATRPTSDVVVVVTRRSLLRSLYIESPVVTRWFLCGTKVA